MGCQSNAGHMLNVIKLHEKCHKSPAGLQANFSSGSTGASSFLSLSQLFSVQHGIMLECRIISFSLAQSVSASAPALSS